MKKFLILLMMLLPLQMYAGTTSMDAQAEKVNVFNAQKTEVLSDVALANVEALADNENRKPCEDVCYYYEGWKCTRIINGVSFVCEPYRLK